jgi:hypothetical protein
MQEISRKRSPPEGFRFLGGSREIRIRKIKIRIRIRRNPKHHPKKGKAAGVRFLTVLLAKGPGDGL